MLLSEAAVAMFYCLLAHCLSLHSINVCIMRSLFKLLKDEKMQQALKKKILVWIGKTKVVLAVRSIFF